MTETAVETVIAALPLAKRFVLFIDYDGTLSPIVPEPSKAYLSREGNAVLTNLCSRCPTTIVTGRSLQTITNFLDLSGGLPDSLGLATSHGMQIDLPASFPLAADCVRSLTVGEEYTEQLADLKRLLEKQSDLPHGCVLEDNRFCVSLHYRHVEPADRPALETFLMKLLLDFPYVRLCKGKLVYELRVKVEWHKGAAVDWILDRIPFECSPIYIGDDITDEDGFNAVNRRNGFSVFVGSQQERQTCANFSLPHPDAVINFLHRLCC